MTDEELRSELKKYHHESFGWAVHCCDNDHALAREVLQTSYLKVLEAKSAFRREAHFKTWFFTIIRNTGIDMKRQNEHRNKKFIVLQGYTEAYDNANEKPEAGPAFLKQALATLSERQKELMHLVFYQEMSLDKAAVIMNISGGSARTHYHRAKKQLAVWIENNKVHE